MFGMDVQQSVAPSDKIYPKGQLQLNAMRLADIFSDDSNFRSFITTHFVRRYFFPIIVAKGFSCNTIAFFWKFCIMSMTSTTYPVKSRKWTSGVGDGRVYADLATMRTALSFPLIVFSEINLPY